MIVLITNLTDAPGKTPVQLDIYNKTLDPGAQIKLPADLINAKVKALETAGLISIGNLPPWYESAKTRKGKPTVGPKPVNVVPIRPSNRDNKKKKDQEETRLVDFRSTSLVDKKQEG